MGLFEFEQSIALVIKKLCLAVQSRDKFLKQFCILHFLLVVPLPGFIHPSLVLTIRFYLTLKDLMVRLAEILI